MTRQQTLEKLTEHLHTLDDEALESVLRLVERIPPEDDAWDAQMRADAEAGKLDKLAEKALEDYRAGRTKEL